MRPRPSDDPVMNTRATPAPPLSEPTHPAYDPKWSPRAPRASPGLPPPERGQIRAGQPGPIRLSARESRSVPPGNRKFESVFLQRGVGLGAGLAETWNTLDYLAEAGIRYVCDWVNDDQPYLFHIGNPPLVSLPYSVQTNDVPAYFEMKVSVPEFEAMLRRQFDTLYREGETIPRVMAIAVHPFVTGQAHRIGALDSALDYICSHAGVWRATGWEIVQHFLAQQPGAAR